MRNGEPVATLAPARPPDPPKGITLRELAELLKNTPMPDDRFADDLEEIQASQPPLPPLPSWE